MDRVAEELIADEIRRRCGKAFAMPELMAWGIVKRLEEEGYVLKRQDAAV